MLGFVMRLTALALLALAPVPAAGAPTYVQNPSVRTEVAPVRIDVAAGTVDGRMRPLVEREPAGAIRFDDLDRAIGPAPRPDPAARRAALPEGLVQHDDMIVPRGVEQGAMMVPDLAKLGAPRSSDAPADSCDFPEEVPPGIYEGDDRPGGEYPRRGTVYLNFVGGVLEAMGENSAENRSTIARTGHPYPAFTGGQAKAIAVAQAVAQDFEAWAIRVVYDPRPRKLLPYTMAMVGGSYTDTTSGPAGGVAPIDCEDFGQRNVCYSFTNEQDATTQANVISQEVAHTYGLEHTYGPDRIMSYEGGGDKIFGSNCQQTFAVQGQGNGCQGVNKCHCGIGDLQDDSKTIGIIYESSAAPPDTTPPEVTLTSPADGSVFQVGEEIRVAFDVWDDYGGYGWKLVVQDEAGETLVDQVDYDRTLLFDIVGLPPGTYTFIGEVEDQADHVTTHAVTVIVQGDGSSDTTGGGEASGGAEGSGGDTGGDGGSSDSTSSGNGSDGDGGSAGADGADEGCGCTHDPGRAAAWLLAPLALLRRRRGAYLGER